MAIVPIIPKFGQLHRKELPAMRGKIEVIFLLASALLFHVTFCDDSDEFTGITKPIPNAAGSSSNSHSSEVLMPPSRVPSSSSSTSPASPFVVEPAGATREPLYLKENEPGPVLKCGLAPGFRNRSRYELEWLQVAEHTPIIVSRNQRLYKTDAYELTDTIATNGEYNLRLKSVNFGRDNGRFFCSLNDLETGRQMVSQPASVVVLVPPLPPRISIQPNEPVRENELVTFRCEASGGNPPPRFSWTFENRSRVPESWYHEKYEHKRGYSILQWHVKSHDNKASLYCLISNPALGRDESLIAQTNRLNVLYAPRVRIEPGYELYVEEGETVDFMCSADANPPATNFEWVHIGTGETFSDAKWSFSMRRAHSGEFYCTVTNSIGSATEKLHANVQYAPIVKIAGAGSANANSGGKISPAEGERLVLECEVDANPRVTTIGWTGPNGFSQNGSRFIIDQINRSYSGTFTCRSSNTLQLSQIHSPSKSPQEERRSVVRTGQASIAVDVRHRPGPAVIIAARTAALVGDSFTLLCRTDGDPGSPSAKFRWIIPSSAASLAQIETNRAELKITEAQLLHSGMYRCIPYNEIGDGDSVTMEILVVDPPKILTGLTPPNNLKAGGNGGNTKAEILCEVRGHPTPRIRWLRDGVLIPTTGSDGLAGHWIVQNRPSQVIGNCNNPNEACPVKVSSLLRFAQPVDWRDKGNYTCQAENSAIAPVVQTSTLVTIMHDPVILNQRFAPDGTGLAAADVGRTARISCVVSARPNPTVFWYKDGVEIGSQQAARGRHRATTSKLFDRLDEFESVLELGDVSEADFGSYVCKARNSAGLSSRGNTETATKQPSEIEIRLQQKSSPQTPTQLRMLSSSLSWILVGWKPGFDGGERQLFEVEYRTIDPYTGEVDSSAEPNVFFFGANNSTSMLVYEANDQERSMEPPVPEVYMVQNLTALRLLSSYWFRLRAKNSLGMSDWTAIGTASTRDVTIDSAEIPAPESMAYLSNEWKLNVMLPRMALAQPHFTDHHCVLVYVKSSSDGAWRTLDCFPIAGGSGSASSDAIGITKIWHAQGYKARYCLKDLSKCSAPIQIYLESTSFSQHALVVVAVLAPLLCAFICIFFLLLALRRRRSLTQQALLKAMTNGKNGVAALKYNSNKHKTNKNGVGTGRKTFNGGITIDRIDFGQVDKSTDNIHALKKNHVNGSQSDSGVFTLNGSNSATTAAALAIGTRGMHSNAVAVGNNYRRSTFYGGGGGVGGIEDPIEHNGSLSDGSSGHHLQVERVEPYDFSTDPYLADFVAANEHNGIVVVENGLHSHSSPGDSPACANGENRYAKFFESLSALIGGGGGSGGNGSIRHQHHQHGDNSFAMEKAESGDTFVLDSDGNSSHSYNGHGGGGQQRVMREIIV